VVISFTGAIIYENEGDLTSGIRLLGEIIRVNDAPSIFREHILAMDTLEEYK